MPSHSAALSRTGPAMQRGRTPRQRQHHSTSMLIKSNATITASARWTLAPMSSRNGRTQHLSICCSFIATLRPTASTHALSITIQSNNEDRCCTPTHGIATFLAIVLRLLALGSLLRYTKHTGNRASYTSQLPMLSRTGDDAIRSAFRTRHEGPRHRWARDTHFDKTHPVNCNTWT